MSVHDEWEESNVLQRAAVALILAIAAWWIAGCGRDVKPIQNSVPSMVQTPPPAAFWICPTANRCDASVNPSDIPPRYVCIVQKNGLTACSPGGQVTLPTAPASKPMTVPMTRKQLIEHLALGAGAYAGLYAVAGSGRQAEVAIAGTALVAGFKEGSDALSGRDSRKQAVIHAITILVGAGAVAAFKH